MIELRNVSKRFGRHDAIRDLNITFDRGAAHVLIGPSGCGKSTLLRLIVGLVEPDAGQVLFDGTIVNRQTAASVRRRVGYMIQEGGLFPHLTAGANATIMPRFLHWPAGQTVARLRELSELTRLAPDVLERYPFQISGGQRQRVSLMRALMLNPDALLLDEPLGDLDPMIRANLQEDLRQAFRALKKTVVLVTHDLAEAGYLGDRISLMRDGRIVQQGGFEDLVERPVDDFARKFVQAQRRIA
jgi:osmoprotectant transport system ATP-binding protein